MRKRKQITKNLRFHCEGNALLDLYRQRISTCRIHEVDYFSALNSAINSPQYLVRSEIVHGSKSHVLFNTGCKEPWMRAQIVCELADLLIVCFKRDSPSIRICFVQVKLERGSSKESYDANLEQWYLLNKKPDLYKARRSKFDPPRNLLNFSKFKTIGSFLFLFPYTDSRVSYFCAATYLSPLKSPTHKYAKVKKRSKKDVSNKNECLSVSGLDRFWIKLRNFKVGAPVLDNGVCVDPTILSWLKVSIYAREAEFEKSQIISGIKETLEPFRFDNMGVAAPFTGSILVVDSTEPYIADVMRALFT